MKIVESKAINVNKFKEHLLFLAGKDKLPKLFEDALTLCEMYFDVKDALDSEVKFNNYKKQRNVSNEPKR